MKKLGLLGGISWVSTLDYYKHINEEVNRRLSGLNFAECIIYSVNFNDIQRHGWDNWGNTFKVLSEGCESLKKAGADALVLCANTAHAISNDIELHTGLPVINLVSATTSSVQNYGLKKVGLLGTKFTMEMPFFHEKLQLENIQSLIPDKQETRDYIQKSLKDELGRGIILKKTRKEYLKIINELIEHGAEGIIFGCTEIPLLLKQEDIQVPIFDTLQIHVNAAIDFALS
jgi:aspartate racemase